MKTFLEIGVADFDTLLPLAEKGGWSGWCVEPMPHHVKTLREQAKGLPVAICECANQDGRAGHQPKAYRAQKSEVNAVGCHAGQTERRLQKSHQCRIFNFVNH